MNAAYAAPRRNSRRTWGRRGLRFFCTSSTIYRWARTYYTTSLFLRYYDTDIIYYRGTSSAVGRGAPVARQTLRLSATETAQRVGSSRPSVQPSTSFTMALTHASRHSDDLERRGGGPRPAGALRLNRASRRRVRTPRPAPRRVLRSRARRERCAQDEAQAVGVGERVPRRAARLAASSGGHRGLGSARQRSKSVGPSVAKTFLFQIFFEIVCVRGD